MVLLVQRSVRRLAAAKALLLLVGSAGASAPAAAQTNAPPDITTAGPFSADEGTTSVATLAATDDDTAQGDLVWSIPAGTGGGVDASSFTLSEAGLLAFAAAKDYETPDDADMDRAYEVTVQVSDGTDTDTAALLVTVLNVTELTSITGPSSVGFPENSWSRVATFTASSEEDRGDIRWILGGADNAHFSIDSPPGALRFALDAIAPRIFSEPPDFEAPVDGDAANTYDLTLYARAGSDLTDAFTVAVAVTDVDEEGALSLSSTRPALGVELTAELTDPDGVTVGTEVWQWERSTGRNSWAVIDGAAAASYTPVAADTNTFLRVTATYADEHGTGKSVSEVAPNVVTGPLLTGLTASTDDSQAAPARGLYPAFDPLTLHYGIGCSSTDTVVLTVSAAADARVAVDGVQAGGTPVSVAVSEDSDVAIRVTEASGAATTYVVHCLQDVFFRVETHTFPNTDAFEDLLLFNRNGYFRLMDRNGVLRMRRAYGNPALFTITSHAIRIHRISADGAYRYALRAAIAGYTILDEEFEVVADGVRTVTPLTSLNTHDFQILEDGNYLLMSYEPAMRDFSNIDLPYLDGTDVSSVDVEDSAFQIVTPGAQAVFTWNSWGNVAIEDCVQHRFPLTLSSDPDMRSPDGDYAHINGMHLVDGVLVASMRGCSKVLGIDVRPGATRGDVLWRMGRTNLSSSEWVARDIGPQPLDFINDPEGEFCGQHTARVLPNGNIFLYDNGVQCAIDPWTFDELGREGHDFSRAVEYALDLENHEAVFVRDHSLRGERSYLGYATGNVDVLDNGDWLVSWGRPLDVDVTIPNNEMVTLVDPATGQEKLGIRLRELSASARSRRINATVAPAEAMAPQPEPLTAEFPASEHTSLFHTGAGDAPQVVVAFNQPVVDLSVLSPSISVTGATVASVSPHLEAGEAANAYVIVLTPNGDGTVTVRLVADQSCASSGVCTAGGTVLSGVPVPHVIEADTQGPVLASGGAVANGAALTLTWNEALDETSTPGTSAFAVTVDGAARSVSGVSVSGSTATLVLAPAVVRGDQDIKVGYSPPSSNPLRDVHGNPAEAFSDQTATNDTPNTPPVGLPVVVGKTLVQEELTASVAGITDVDGLDGAVFSYQWYRSPDPAEPSMDAEIAGAVSMDYTLQPADEGASVKVRVTFTDGGGTEQSLLSDATATVAALVATFDASSALEESGTVTIGVTTGGISLAGDETIDLEFGGTATRSLDYRVDSEQLVLTAGSSMVETTLTLLDDDVDDDGETIEITARRLGRTVAEHTVEIVDEDERGVEISESTLPVVEGDAEKYTVVLTSEPTATVEVELRLDPASSDVSTAPPLLTFRADDWDTHRTVTVRAAEDDDAVADGSVVIRHEVNGGDYDPVTAAPVTVTIAENDVPTLSVRDAEVSENTTGDLAVIFRVELSLPSSDKVTADYATSDGSGPGGAAAGPDYEETTGTVRFLALSTTAQRIRVPVVDDAVDEEELETFTLTLRNASGVSLLGGGAELMATGTIRDDDDPEVEASFGASRYEAPEGGSVPATVRLSADPERLVTIPLLRELVSGITEHDYSGVPESIAFGSGQTVREFKFTATDDAVADDGEAVVLRFGSLPPRVSGNGATTLAIQDNDRRQSAPPPPPPPPPSPPPPPPDPAPDPDPDPDPEPDPDPSPTAGLCEPNAETLCLHDGRYEVRVEWWTGDGETGSGQVVPHATTDSGLFTFFAPNNWEVLIKLLDGCALNGHVWVFGASTTDLGYTIRVTDTVTETVKEYQNEPGMPAAAITDGKAFPMGCTPPPF